MARALRAVPSLALAAMACGALVPSSMPPEAPPAMTAADDAVFALAPGIVVDPARPAVYLARPGGGIEAFDSETGRGLWSSDEAAKPLIAQDGLLLAQREAGAGLPLAILEATTGALRQRLDVPLPDGLTAAIDETLALRFTISARAAGDAVIVEWEYLERDDLGVSPPGGRPFARRELGAARVDLEAGTARTLGEGEVPPAAADPLPVPVERLLTTGELGTRPWRAGQILAAARQIHEPGSRRLVLRRWRADTGEALPEVTLSEGRPVAVLAAADQRHLLLVTPLEVVPESPDRYQWAVHSLATGELVASRRAARSATPFCIVQDLLLYLEPAFGRRVEGRWQEAPLRLIAVDPGSGSELWQREVRDPAFRGPVPPRS